MPAHPKRMLSTTARLRAVKVLHTAVWAFFAGAILLLPVAAWRGDFRLAWILAGLVAVECAVIVVNAWSCPLTAVAARYTPDRRPNFDIYLPVWLARWNKVLFGALYLAGLVYATMRWRGR